MGGYDVGGYDVGGYDVGGYDVGGYDVGGYDVGGYDVGGIFIQIVNQYSFIFILSHKDRCCTINGFFDQFYPHSLSFTILWESANTSPVQSLMSSSRPVARPPLRPLLSLYQTGWSIKDQMVVRRVCAISSCASWPW